MKKKTKWLTNAVTITFKMLTFIGIHISNFFLSNFSKHIDSSEWCEFIRWNEMMQAKNSKQVTNRMVNFTIDEGKKKITKDRGIKIEFSVHQHAKHKTITIKWISFDMVWRLQLVSISIHSGKEFIFIRCTFFILRFKKNKHRNEMPNVYTNKNKNARQQQ